jgi:hypothetical protein
LSCAEARTGASAPCFLARVVVSTPMRLKLLKLIKSCVVGFRGKSYMECFFVLRVARRCCVGMT